MNIGSFYAGGGLARPVHFCRLESIQITQFSWKATEAKFIL